MSDNLVGIFLFATLIVGAMLFVIIMLTRKRGGNLNVAQYQSHWLRIESSLKKGEEATYPMAILNADTLLDRALKERGVSGNTMGERMKSAQAMWSNADHVWGAHKVRNKIAHEHDVHITYEVAARSLVAFKQALKDVGAI